MSTNPSLVAALEHIRSYLPNEFSECTQLSEPHSTYQKAQIYWDTLHKWNKTIKLTGARTIDAFAHRHFADSLFGIVGHRYFQNSTRVLDVGAGAGFPSIPLSFVYEDCNWYLVESHHRRCAFLQQVKRTLDLQKVHIHTTRIEGHPEQEGLDTEYDTILFRAVAPEQFLPSAHRYLASKGVILYWGTQPDAPECPSSLQLLQTFPYALQDGEAFCIYLYTHA